MLKAFLFRLLKLNNSKHKNRYNHTAWGRLGI